MPLSWKKVKPKNEWASEAYTAPCSRGGRWRIEYQPPVEVPGLSRLGPPWVGLYPPRGIKTERHNRYRSFGSLDAAKKAAQRLEDSSSTNRLVDYLGCPTSCRGGHNASPVPYLLPKGKEAYDQAQVLVGRKPLFFSVNAKGMTMKWLLLGKIEKSKWVNLPNGGQDIVIRESSPTVEEARVLVYRDWLLDQGLEAEVTYPEPRNPDKDSRRYIQIRVW